MEFIESTSFLKEKRARTCNLSRGIEFSSKVMEDIIIRKMNYSSIMEILLSKTVSGKHNNFFIYLFIFEKWQHNKLGKTEYHHRKKKLF